MKLDLPELDRQSPSARSCLATMKVLMSSGFRGMPGSSAVVRICGVPAPRSLMPRPVLLAVDDDPGVLRAVERDLRKQYSDRYRVMSADSGPAALDVLGRIAQRSESVALLLADYRMPRMTGIEFPTAAIRQFPDVRRVLLTAYADTEAAIHAINVVKLDHYLLKPWGPAGPKPVSRIGRLAGSMVGIAPSSFRRHSCDRDPLVAALL